jgi:DNA-directed RNA polymerase specialized sigma24 family protein
VHEAFKLVRRDRRELSLEAESEQGVLAPSVSPATPYELVENRERLASVSGLPERQQRALWLHALGLSYVEIARHERCTVRTVERQLLRARHNLRDAPAR